jgi:hypothetical protein
VYRFCTSPQLTSSHSVLPPTVLCHEPSILSSRYKAKSNTELRLHQSRIPQLCSYLPPYTENQARHPSKYKVKTSKTATANKPTNSIFRSHLQQASTNTSKSPNYTVSVASPLMASPLMASPLTPSPLIPSPLTPSPFTTSALTISTTSISSIPTATLSSA